MFRKDETLNLCDNQFKRHKNTPTNRLKISIPYCNAWIGLWVTIMASVVSKQKPAVFMLTAYYHITESSWPKHLIIIAEVKMIFKWAYGKWSCSKIETIFVLSRHSNFLGEPTLVYLCCVTLTASIRQFIHNTQY